MAKRGKKRQVVYHNNNTDNWTNDDKEQLSLIPGTDGYKARKEQLQMTNSMSDINIDSDMERQLSLAEQRKLEKSEKEDDSFVDAFEKGRKSASVVKYRNKMKRRDAVQHTAKIASDGIGRTVTENEIEFKTDDPYAQASDVPKSLKTFEPELAQREVPMADVDKDGDIDKDDVVYTPGMRRLRKYM